MKIHWVEGTFMLHDVSTPSWEELEVKIRETLKNVLGLESMDSVSVDFDTHGTIDEDIPAAFRDQEKLDG